MCEVSKVRRLQTSLTRQILGGLGLVVCEGIRVGVSSVSKRGAEAPPTTWRGLGSGSVEIHVDDESGRCCIEGDPKACCTETQEEFVGRVKWRLSRILALSDVDAPQ